MSIDQNCGSLDELLVAVVVQLSFQFLSGSFKQSLCHLILELFVGFAGLECADVSGLQSSEFE